jgi:uncharacterized coiled-coil protein SlyX
MPSLEERVAFLEGRLSEHDQTTDGLRDDVFGLRAEMLRLFDEVRQRFERIDERLDRIDAKIERHFPWLVGLQMAGLLAIFGALAGGYFK